MRKNILQHWNAGALGRWGAGALGLLLVCHVNAADVNKDNNADALELGSSWVGGIAPSGTDAARFDSAAGSQPSLTIDADMSFGNFLFDGSIASDITISGTGVVTLNAENNYVYGKHVTISNNVIMSSSNNWTSFQVRTGGTLTVSGTWVKSAAAAVQTLQVSGASGNAGVVNVTGYITDFNTFRIASGATLNLSGTMKQSPGNILSNSNAVKSTVNLTGDGKFENTAWLVFGGGAWQFVGDWNMSGNSQVVATNLQLGDNSANSKIVFNQNGGTVNLSAGTVQLYSNTTGASAGYNLNGGTLNLKEVRVSANSTFKLDGGTLKLIANSADLFKQVGAGNAGRVIVSAGGAIIDTNGKVVSASDTDALPLEHDTALSGGDGGLRVIGGGALFLSKANTYDGGTVIEKAVLSVGANATLGTGDVVVSDSSTLQLFNNAAIDSGATLTFGSDVYIALDYNGTLTLAGLYDQTANHWFDAGEYSAANLSAYGFSGLGSLTVIPEPSTWLLLITGAGLLSVTRRIRVSLSSRR
ncbi:MAG: PEP-CTERM sorting domain-containing protein [Verrucomicrobiales bacterium]|nr:PEP-CTERM sorting domain-containing protein [Verrucomicrobiales bacterium]